jgi:hypothetical protein
MSAKTVGFVVEDKDRPRLQILVDYFGDGDRAEFLRVAMECMTQQMCAEKTQLFQEQARGELAGPGTSAN